MTQPADSDIPQSMLVRLTFRSSGWERVRDVIEVMVDEVEFVLVRIHKRPYRKIEAWFAPRQSVLDRSDSP